MLLQYSPLETYGDQYFLTTFAPNRNRLSLWFAALLTNKKRGSQLNRKTFDEPKPNLLMKRTFLNIHNIYNTNRKTHSWMRLFLSRGDRKSGRHC